MGTKWDRWEVVGRGFGKMKNGGNGCRGGRKSKFSKMLSSVFPASGDQKRDISGSEAVTTTWGSPEAVRQ